MARIRTIKPELFQSYTIKRLSLHARWTFLGMLTHVDDDGYCRDEPRIIKGAVWPLEDDITWANVANHIEELLHAGLVCRFHHNGVPHLHVVTFREHQVINRATKSRLPHCPDHPLPNPSKPGKSKPDPEAETTTHAPLTEDSVSPPAPVTDGSSQEGKGKGREREVERELQTAAAPHEPATDPAEPPTPASQPAAAAAPNRTRTPPPKATPLVDELAAAGLIVGWNLYPHQWQTIVDAIDRSGIPALVDHALRSHKPHDPARFATAWLDGWSSLPPLTQDSPLHPQQDTARPAPLTARQQRRARNLAVIAEAAALEGITLGPDATLGIAS